MTASMLTIGSTGISGSRAATILRTALVSWSWASVVLSRTFARILSGAWLADRYTDG